MPATDILEAVESLHAAFLDAQNRRRMLQARAEQLHADGRLAEAENAWLELARTGYAPAWAALSGLYSAQGRFDDALDAAAQSLGRDPDLAGAHASFGVLIRDSPAADRARDMYASLTTRPRESSAIDHLRAGHAALARSSVDEAIELYTRARRAAPPNACVYSSLATAYGLKGDRLRSLMWSGVSALHDEDYQSAIDALSVVADTDVATPDVHLSLGDSYHALARFAEAAAAYERGYRRWPSDAMLCLRAVETLHKLGKTAAAIRLARAGMRTCPSSLALRRARCLTLPIVYANDAEIDRYRRRFRRGLDHLAAATHLETPEGRREAAFAIRPNFYLAYQGRDDKELQVRYGAWAARIAEASYGGAAATAAGERTHDGRIRIGYVSGHLHRHAVADLFFGWVRHADRTRFEVHAYHLGPSCDFVSDAYRAHVDRFRHVPDGVETACRHIAADRLDVLTYLDVGMFPAATALASLRLAPVQCVAWGHPVTSGLAAIDYFISSELMEPVGADSHYSETLVRLPGIGIAFTKPERPRRRVTREDLGIDRGAVVFLCVQSPYKYLPAYDAVLVDIARRVRSAQFVFIRHPGATKLEARLARAFGDAGLDFATACRFLPPQRPSGFLNLLAEGDVFLDTIGWSGGHTALEAIAMDVPIVTLPGATMRSRHAAAMLRALDVTETVAGNVAEYVDIAVRLATDCEWRRRLRTRVSANHGKLFDDVGCVRALEAFYANARKAVNH